MTTVNRKKILASNKELAGRYRLAGRDDLVSGAELFMVLIPSDGSKAEGPCPLVLDHDPVRWSYQLNDRCVFYFSQGYGVFVPFGQFVGIDVEPFVNCPYLTALYLVKM